MILPLSHFLFSLFSLFSNLKKKQEKQLTIGGRCSCRRPSPRWQTSSPSPLTSNITLLHVGHLQGVTKHHITSAFYLSAVFLYISIVHRLYYQIKSEYEKCVRRPGLHPGNIFWNVNSLILGVTCQFLYSWHFGVSAEKSAEPGAQSIELVERLVRSGGNGSAVYIHLCVDSTLTFWQSQRNGRS